MDTEKANKLKSVVLQYLQILISTQKAKQSECNKLQAQIEEIRRLLNDE